MRGARRILCAAFAVAVAGSARAAEKPAAAPTLAAVPATAALYEETRAAMRSADPQDRRQGIVNFLRAVEKAEKSAPPPERDATAQAMVRPMKAEVLKAAADSEPGANLAAALLMRDLPADADVVAALLHLATAPYREVRYAALGSLSAIGNGSPAAHTFALDMLRSEEPARFAAGAYLAGKWQMLDAVPLLMQALEKHNLVLMRDSAAALSHMGPGADAAVPALRSAIRTLDAMQVTPPRVPNADEYREGEVPADLPDARQAIKDAIQHLESLPSLR